MIPGSTFFDIAYCVFAPLPPKPQHRICVMKTFLLHHTPKSANQDTWTVTFSLPYIASEYAPAGNGVWYVRTWLGADQIKRRLAILFDTPDELIVHELGRADAAGTSRLTWLEGRLEDDDLDDTWHGPRGVWTAIQSAVVGTLAAR
jgi:hypothetical protein